MKYLATLLMIAFGIYSCDSSKSTIKEESTISEIDTVRIANDTLEYEILIIEPGFNSWVLTQPPRGHLSIDLLESRNYQYVLEYNNRVRHSNYSRLLYEQEINYDPNTRYGLEVNYLLYNYFKYFEQKYEQKLR